MEEIFSGEKSLRTTYSSTGIKKSTANIDSNSKEKVEISFYESGNKESESNFINYMLDGAYTEWYENGNLNQDLIKIILSILNQLTFTSAPFLPPFFQNIMGLISELKIIDENELEKIKFREVTNSTGQKIGKMKFVL